MREWRYFLWTIKTKYLFVTCAPAADILLQRGLLLNIFTRTWRSNKPVLVMVLVEAKKIASISLKDGYRIRQASAKWYMNFFMHLINFCRSDILMLWGEYFIKHISKKESKKNSAQRLLFFILFNYAGLPVLRELGLTILCYCSNRPVHCSSALFQRKQQQFIVFSERLKNYCLNGESMKKVSCVIFLLSSMKIQCVALLRTNFTCSLSIRFRAEEKINPYYRRRRRHSSRKKNDPAESSFRLRWMRKLQLSCGKNKTVVW